MNSITNYLTNSLRRGKIYFPITYLENYPKTVREVQTVISNPLFELKYKCYSNLEPCIYFKHKNTPNTNIIKFLFDFEHDDYYIPVKQEDNKTLSFETSGAYPIRWLYMLKDFHFPEASIELKEPLELEKIVNSIPNVTLKEIVYQSLNKQSSFGFEVINQGKKSCNWYRDEIGPDEKIWYTGDGKLSPYTKSILKKASELSSFKGSSLSKVFFDTVFSAQGGLVIQNEFIEDYVNFYRDYIRGSIYFEISGRTQYYSQKEINGEELVCLYLAIKKFTQDNNEIKIKPYD
jgi:hypothetical protein